MAGACCGRCSTRVPGQGSSSPRSAVASVIAAATVSAAAEVKSTAAIPTLGTWQAWANGRWRSSCHCKGVVILTPFPSNWSPSLGSSRCPTAEPMTSFPEPELPDRVSEPVPGRLVGGPVVYVFEDAVRTSVDEFEVAGDPEHRHRAVDGRHLDVDATGGRWDAQPRTRQLRAAPQVDAVVASRLK